MTSQIIQAEPPHELVGKSVCNSSLIRKGADRDLSPRRRLSRSKHDVSGTIGQASWLSSVINLVNTIVGAGVLAMPLAMSHMGIVLGTIIIIWAGATAGFGLYLQTKCARYLERGSASFFALSQITYPNAAVIFDAAIAVKCFGVGVSYLIIIGDLMPGVVRGFSDEDSLLPFLVDRHFWVTFFMLIVIPLSFLRRLDSLKYTSFIALISIGYLVILVVYHFIARDTFEGARPPVRVVHWAGPIQTLSSFPSSSSHTPVTKTCSRSSMKSPTILTPGRQLLSSLRTVQPPLYTSLSPSLATFPSVMTLAAISWHNTLHPFPQRLAAPPSLCLSCSLTRSKSTPVEQAWMPSLNGDRSRYHDLLARAP